MLTKNIAETIAIDADGFPVEIIDKSNTVLLYIFDNRQCHRRLWRYVRSSPGFSFAHEADGKPIPIQNGMLSLPNNMAKRLKISSPFACYQVNIAFVVYPAFHDMLYDVGWHWGAAKHHGEGFPFCYVEEIASNAAKIPYGMGTLARAPREQTQEEKAESRKYAPPTKYYRDVVTVFKTDANGKVTREDTETTVTTRPKNPKIEEPIMNVKIGDKLELFIPRSPELEGHEIIVTDVLRDWDKNPIAIEFVSQGDKLLILPIRFFRPIGK